MKGKQKRSSIQRQLLLNILPALVIALLLFSYVNYRYNKAALEKNYAQQQRQIIHEIQGLSALYSYSQKTHEKSFDNRMKELSEKMVNEIFVNDDDAAKMNLYEVSKQLGMDTTKEFIYIINRNGVVINTTFKKDYLLDFYKLDPGFKTRFEKMFATKTYTPEPFSYEMATMLTKKYSYMPTRQGKYLVELGFQSNEAQHMRDMLDSLTLNIASEFPEIKEISANLCIEDIPNTQIKHKFLWKAVNQTLKEKKNRQVTYNVKGEKLIANIFYLPIQGSSLFDGYIVITVRDTRKEQELLWNELTKFSIITLLTAFPILLVVYFRARKLTAPIKDLAQKAGVISGGNLEERINVVGNNEITVLSENFNVMIEKLQESYEGLEQKVRDRTAEITSQKHIIEEKQKEIVDSINYAKRIQDAILPTDEEITKTLPTAFVLYKPKDIVAGDFYWLETKEKLVMIAAADCTGHGVPGAMVSVVCSGALTRSVREFGLTKPGSILDKTTELVLETLDKNNGDVKDGMDITLLTINLNQNILMYSGANNPLWLVRPVHEQISEAIITETEIAHGTLTPALHSTGQLTTENRQLHYECIEIKADKQPIGKFENRKPFNTHMHEIQPGDKVYLFTDGYADQFGGEKGKKFKYSTLQKVILENAHKPAAEQKEILDKTFDAWKGNYEQTDDVCIIGISF
ncbi:MAG TPA: SpoIIE family protein phosphatase [Flavobacteriales bacterium]|nr:SpoIIE family protein phosphatase [Flavobacteriales bacterium]